ncbi:MAG: glycosyl hydrolase [Bacteroidota bacterium]|jgi:glycosyltransferase involved in cell wall biosynthesis|nr:glycosyl hydrolase [Bacteroidota bacterium]
MAKIKLSVCIPVFNGENFIEEAINSVLNQNFNEFELIIVDNNSTDKTSQIISKINDPRIKFFRNESNIGLIPNWNKSLEYVQGEYVKILPADDFLYPECLQKQCAILDNDYNHEISMVCSGRNIINNNGKVLFRRCFSNEEGAVNGIFAINKNVRSGGNIIGEGGAVLFRKDILKKTGLFNSPIFYVLDLDLWYKILLHGNLYVFPQPLSAFRVSGSSASVQVVNQQFEDLSKFNKDIYLKKEYKVTWLNYKLGLAKALMLTQAKKILYKYILK